MTPSIHQVRPRLQLLEDRTAPATFTVTNTGDSAPGSLRRRDHTGGDASNTAGNMIVFSNT